MDRTINEVLEKCKPRECDREILDIAYKTRMGIPLTSREKEISKYFFKRR